jgi:hypothetical protein
MGNQTQALQLPQSHTSGRTASAWAYQNPQVGADRFEAASFLGMTVEKLEQVYGHHHPDLQQNVGALFSRGKAGRKPL